MSVTKKLKSKIFAYTLSEVILALLIAGIIIMIILPVLYNDINKRITVVSLKKVYSEMTQAVNRSKLIYGDVSSWNFDLPLNDFFNLYLCPYIKTTENTIAQSGVKYYQSCGKEETGLRVMGKNGIVYTTTSGVQFFTGPEETKSNAHMTRCYGVDINGYKGPNRYGRDLFMLCIDPRINGVIPHYTNDGEDSSAVKTRDELINGKGSYNYQCNKINGRGMWCAALLIYDGWEIKSDYPW